MGDGKDGEETVEQRKKSDLVKRKTVDSDIATKVSSTFSDRKPRSEHLLGTPSDSSGSIAQPEGQSNSIIVTNTLPNIKIVTSSGNKQKLFKIISSKDSSSKLVILPKLIEQLRLLKAPSSQVEAVDPHNNPSSPGTHIPKVVKCSLPSDTNCNVVLTQKLSMPTEPVSLSTATSSNSCFGQILNVTSSLPLNAIPSDKQKSETLTHQISTKKILILKPSSTSKLASSGHSGEKMPVSVKSEIPQNGSVTSVPSSIKIIGVPISKEKTSVLSQKLDLTAQTPSASSVATLASTVPAMCVNTAIRPSLVTIFDTASRTDSMGRISIPPTSLLKPMIQPTSSSASTAASVPSTAKTKIPSRPVQSNLCLVVPTGVSAVVDVTLDSSCKILASVKHPGRKTAYSDIVKLLMEKHEDSRMIDKLKAKVLPIALYDIKNLASDAEMDGAFEFLGNFLQACKLEPVMEDSVIKTLTLKILKTTSKLESKKAMWCLAHVDYRESISNELLITMLSSALLYLSECPPIPSLGTVCEGLNVVQHMYYKSPKFILNELGDILNGTFPLLFHETSRLRELALALLQPLAPVICERKLLSESFQEKYRSTYHSRMLYLVGNESPEGLILWRFLIESFGDALHSNNQLINDLLKLEELALKSNNFEFRLIALQSWRWLINCFARNPSLMTQKKRLKLLMVPFTSSESKTAALARTKIELWWHILECLGTKAVDCSGDVTLVCLNFCFGGRNHPRGAVDAYPSLTAIATASLIGILSPDESFNQWDFKRSVHFINTASFIRYREEILYVCQRALVNLEGDKHWDLFEVLVSTFLKRCLQVNADPSFIAQQVESLTGCLIDLPESKPNMTRVVLSCFLNSFDNPIFFTSFVKKIKSFLKWPCLFYTKFPTDMYEEVIRKFFEVGTRVPIESIPFIEEMAVCLETVKNVMPSNIFKITLARQWSELVQLVLTRFSDEAILQIDSMLFFFPLSIVDEMRSGCEKLWETWSSYFVRIYEQDPSVLKIRPPKSIIYEMRLAHTR